MNTLIIVLISGMATSYIIEFIGSFMDSDRWIKRILTLPLAVTASWIMGITDLPLVVVGLASAFVSLAILLLLNRRVTINTITRR
jgi:phosphotransferase system  glucose/maltose/N-acetylglucosamine-specific IIC component